VAALGLLAVVVAGLPARYGARSSASGAGGVAAS
jgi:hypothetical protein